MPNVGHLSEELPMKRLALALVMLAAFAASAEAAYIAPRPSMWGGMFIDLAGEIAPGDEQTFAAVAKTMTDPAQTVVLLNSRGGDVVTALRIAMIVRDRGFTTRLIAKHLCASACPIIWFSGRHAEIQIRSRLIFHVPYDARTGEASPLAIEAIVEYLQTVGLTERQARLLITAAPPSGGWMATVPAGYALGFNPQIISSLWGWNSCTAKFCLAVP